MSAEWVVNLWAVYDAGTGLIYALAGRPYFASGSDAEKLAFLQHRSASDHVDVRRYEVPERFRVSYADGTVQRKVTTLNSVSDLHADLFEEMFRNIESDLPVVSNSLAEHIRSVPRRLPKDPLCVTTVLYEDDAGNVRPIITDEDRKWIAAQEQAHGRRSQVI